MADSFTQSERLALYKLLIEQTNTVGAARRESSRFFLTLNTAAFGALGFVVSEQVEFPLVISVILAAGLAMVSVMWLSLLRYYSRVLRAKYDVIETVEDKFEIRPFELEGKKLYSGKRRSLGATALESSIPVFFILAYIAAGVYAGVQVDWQALLNGHIT